MRPRISPGDRHSPPQAAGPGVIWEEKEEEEVLSHLPQGIFPAPRLKEMGRKQLCHSSLFFSPPRPHLT